MNLIWREIKNHKLTLLGAPILCAVAVVLLVLLFWLESISRGAIERETVIIIEAEQELLEDNSMDSAGPDDSQTDVKKLTLPAALNERFSELTSRKNSSSSKPVDFLSGIPQTDYSTQERQLFYERMGRFFVSNKDYKTAVSAFAQIPNAVYIEKRSGFYYALALSKVGQSKKAIKIYANQLAVDPNHQASAMNYGLLLLKTKQYEKSIPALEHAIDVTSGKRKAKALRHIGNAYQKTAQIDKSIEAYRRSILFEPDNSQSWLLLGNAMSEKKDIAQDKIILTLQKAVLLAPDNYKARLSLAEFYFSRLEFESARVEFMQASKRASDHSDLRLMQALNLFASGRAVSAKKVLQELEDANTIDEQVAEFINYLVASDYEKAKPVLQQMNKNRKFDKNLLVYLQLMYFVENTSDEPIAGGRVEADLDSIFYWPSKLLLAKYLNKRARYADAIVVEKEILEKIPNSAEALLEYGRSLSKSGDQKLALQTLARAYELQSSSRRISVEYINELKKSRDYVAALSVVNSVLKQQPNYSHAQRLKVDLLRKTGQIDDAINLSSKLFNSDEENIEDGYMLAELQYEAGKVKESLQSIATLLDLDSANIAARLLRAKILFDNSRLDESAVEVTLILRLDPKNLEALKLKEHLVEKNNFPDDKPVQEPAGK